MKLGAFSISLNVKDISASKAFYQKLGFTEFGGNVEHKWLILKNADNQLIGLFEGMLEKNTLTFNPGWDQCANEIAEFMDVRDIQAALKQQGIECISEADESSSGPASMVVIDPDGNPILIDQHRN